jgi:O-acetyl-ADP-ribose deacetylase (regulator of RNase III)
MIEIRPKGDLLKEPVDALVNTVNCVGVMGKGIALQFKLAFPENFKAYKKACDNDKLQIGKVFVTETGKLLQPKYIINFPTKLHWREKSKLEYIEKGMEDLIEKIKALKIKSIALPPLGCGNGGLNWNDVKNIMVQRLEKLNDVEVILFGPSGSPSAKVMKIGTQKPKITPGRAALIGLLKNYKQVGYEITHLEIQKLMYFLQTAGEPLRLNFKKHKYGPYANELHHVLQSMEGHFIKGYSDRSQKIQISLLSEGIKQAEEFLPQYKDTLERFHRVRELIEGFETPYGLELLATVHWTIEKDNIKNLPEIIQSIQTWNPRKKDLFGLNHIQIAKQRLEEKHFV